MPPRAALAADSGDELWSVYVQALGRKFLRAGVYRKEDGSTAQEPDSRTLSAKASSAPPAAGTFPFGSADASSKTSGGEE